MKKLKKVLLINWLYFGKQVVEFGDINFLTGKNSVGKSTLIDALQVVLLGETSGKNFNKAANDKAARTIAGYLYADSGSTDEMDVKHSRKGQMFETYIVCEFFDDVEIKSFSMGVVFDCEKSGEFSYKYFWHENGIPENCYIENNYPMDKKKLREYLKDTFKKQRVFDTVKDYKEDILSRFNVHTERYFSMIKKAVSFKQITNIQQFITENICEVDGEISIEEMQENIRSYKRQEELAKNLQKRKEALTEIQSAYGELIKLLQTIQTQEYVVCRADFEKTQAEIEQKLQSLNENRKRIKLLKEEISALELQYADIEKERDEWVIKREGNSAQKEFDRLEEEIERKSKQIEEIEKKVKNVVFEIRREGLAWKELLVKALGELEIVLDRLKQPELSICYESVRGKLEKLAQLSVDEFSGQDEEFWTEYSKDLDSFVTSIKAIAFAFNSEYEKMQHERETLLAEIKRLEGGNKSYNPIYIEFKERLQYLYKENTGKTLQCDFLADVIEMKEERWHNVTEGYLNTQRFYLLVQPEDFDKVYKIFKQLKASKNYAGTGIVDIYKLRKDERLEAKQGSLAEKIATDNSLARSYIDYLLGKVMCREEEEDFRKYFISVTPSGVRYQNYVLAPMNSDIWKNLYIGKKSIELTLVKKKEELQELTAMLDESKTAYEIMQKIVQRHSLIGDSFINLTVLPAINDYKQARIMANEVEELLSQKRAIDLSYSQIISQKIKELDVKKTKVNDDKTQKDKECAVLESENKRLNNECMQLDSDVQKKESRLKYALGILDDQEEAERKYSSELSRLNNDLQILYENFQNNLEGNRKKYFTKREGLSALRSKFNQEYSCGYNIHAETNEEFDKALDRIINNDLPLYLQKIAKAKESALEQFQNEFLNKLKSNIDRVVSQVKNLNRALRSARFGNDEYEFIVERNEDYAQYYNMIMDPDLMEEGYSLFAHTFQEKYKDIIEDLFSKIASSDDEALNAKQQTELENNIKLYTDYRTYLNFDLKVKHPGSIEGQRLSKTLFTKSGGENQTPFYIAIVASFAQLYHVYDTSDLGNTMRLVIFDEAFNKMDGERIVECINLFKRSKLQVLMSAPPEKVPDITPLVDNTLCVYKENYNMCVLPYEKKQGEFA